MGLGRWNSVLPVEACFAFGAVFLAWWATLPMDTKTPRPIFILALGYHPNPAGGSFRYVRALAEGLVTLGHAVHVFAPLPRGLPATPGFQADIRDGVIIHWFPQGRGWRGKAWMLENKSAWKRMGNLLQKLQPQQPVLLGTHAVSTAGVR